MSLMNKPIGTCEQASGVIGSRRLSNQKKRIETLYLFLSDDVVVVFLVSDNIKLGT